MLEGARQRRVVYAVGVLAVCVLVGALVAGYRLLSNHQRYGAWAWKVTAPTVRIPYEGRTYYSSGASPAPPPGSVVVGRMPDGHAVLRVPGQTLPTTLFVVLNNRSTQSYALSGGP